MIAFLKKFEKVTRIINASSAHFLKLGAVNIFLTLLHIIFKFLRHSIKLYKLLEKFATFISILKSFKDIQDKKYMFVLLI